MKTHVFAVALAAMTAAAMTPATAQPGQAGSHNPAVKESKPHAIAAPARGANSFTQAQAKGRLAKAGYTGTSTLVKDRNGAWTGTAKKGGKSVRVALDYKGNVSAR